MSDRIKALVVTLRPDMRDDDAEPLINAVRMIKGVIAVEPQVAGADHMIAVQHAKYQLTQAAREAIEKLML